MKPKNKRILLLRLSALNQSDFRWILPLNIQCPACYFNPFSFNFRKYVSFIHIMAEKDLIRIQKIETLREWSMKIEITFNMHSRIEALYVFMVTPCTTYIALISDARLNLQISMHFAIRHQTNLNLYFVRKLQLV